MAICLQFNAGDPGMCQSVEMQNHKFLCIGTA